MLSLTMSSSEPEARLPSGERDVNTLLAELESRERELSDREKEAAEISEDAKIRARRVAERETAVRDRERNAEREARKEARKLLLDARAEVDRTIRELKEASSAAADEAAREARRRMEQLAAAEGKALADLEEKSEETTRSSLQSAEIAEGDYVSVATLGDRTARVVEFRDGDAIVAFGSVKMTVPRSALSPARAPDGAERVHIAIRGDIPEIEAKSEIDLRGLRAGEIEDVVMQAVDSAVRADLKSLRIIHGKGTGVLRERVAEMLRKESRVSSFRLGAWNEGGAGVTVAELS